MSEIITKKYDIEVCTSPQLVEVFINYVSDKLDRYSNNKAEFIVSIPVLSICFCLPISCNLYEIEKKLEGFGVTPLTWIEPLSKGIYDSVETLSKELNLKNSQKDKSLSIFW